MPKAGAAGGAAPAPAPNAPDTSESVKAQNGAKGKNSAPPLPETSGRALPEPARAAVALAATLAGLHVGQDVRGTVRLLPGQPYALLTTPQGDFLLSPAAGLEAEAEISLVLARADRSLTALLLTAGGKTLDPPRPAALTLIAVRTGTPPPATLPPTPPSPPTPAPAPGRPAPAALPAPPPVMPTPALTSLLPGEAVALRGSGTVSLPYASLPHAPAPFAAPAGTPAAPRPSASPRVLPAHSGLVPPPQLQPRGPAFAPHADPVAALFERGALTLTLHRQRTDQTHTHTPAQRAGRADPLALPQARPQQALTAHLLGSAAPGERTPLTHPPANSPLARLAEAGRLVTATVLPPGAQAAPDTAAQARDQPAPPERPVVRLSAGSGGLRLDLPAGTPAPAPGTQLVFLVTRGHEALKAPPPARTPARPSALPDAQANMPARAAAEPQGRGQPATAPSASISTPQASAPHIPNPPVGTSGKAATPTAERPATAQMPAQTAKSAAPAAPAASTPTPETAAPLPPQSLLWAPGLSLPAGARPIAPNLTDATPGAALLMAVLQALGRKGFSARPGTGPASAPVQKDTGAPPATPSLARVHHPHTAQGTMQADAPERTLPTAPLPAPLPSTAPEAAPLALTLQTPQGQIPLLFLIWHPATDEDGGQHTAAHNDGEQDVCFAVDVRFDSLGLLRLRGTVNPAHLQLTVETEHPLGDALERNATQDFLHAIEAGGMTGTLAFRHRR